jgi:hypothetical protein
MSQSQTGENHIMYGKFHSEETKNKMSQSHKGWVPEKISCTYCNKIGAVSQMKRWHMNNCPTIQHINMIII